MLLLAVGTNPYDTIRLLTDKPANLEITLAQYGALARNFTAVAIHHLDDPEFQRLYHEVKKYVNVAFK